MLSEWNGWKVLCDIDENLDHINATYVEDVMKMLLQSWKNCVCDYSFHLGTNQILTFVFRSEQSTSLVHTNMRTSKSLLKLQKTILFNNLQPPMRYQFSSSIVLECFVLVILVAMSYFHVLCINWHVRWQLKQLLA
jgi:hypothetical protein